MSMAAIVERPGVLVVRDVPTPVPGEYDVLCEMLYGATCTGTDHHIIRGRTPWPVNYPVILGHESVGRAIELGRRVRHFKDGDIITRVGAPPAADGTYDVAWGGFAEYGIAKDHRAMREDGVARQLWDAFRVNQVVPSDIDPAAATMIITWRETLSYLTRMDVGADSAVLVIGSGANGLSFVAHAQNLGSVPVVMVGSPSRQRISLTAGATAAFDYHTEYLTGAISQDFPDGFDFIIDAVGKTGQVDRVLPLLKSGGVVGIYGLDDFDAVSINPRRAKGSFTYFNGGYDEEEAHDRVVAFVKAGALDPTIWLDLKHVFALKDIVGAFDAVWKRKTVKALIRLKRSDVDLNNRGSTLRRETEK